MEDNEHVVDGITVITPAGANWFPCDNVEIKIKDDELERVKKELEKLDDRVTKFMAEYYIHHEVFGYYPNIIKSDKPPYLAYDLAHSFVDLPFNFTVHIQQVHGLKTKDLQKKLIEIYNQYSSEDKFNKYYRGDWSNLPCEKWHTQPSEHWSMSKSPLEDIQSMMDVLKAADVKYMGDYIPDYMTDLRLPICIKPYPEWKLDKLENEKRELERTVEGLKESNNSLLEDNNDLMEYNRKLIGENNKLKKQLKNTESCLCKELRINYEQNQHIRNLVQEKEFYKYEADRLGESVKAKIESIKQLEEIDKTNLGLIRKLNTDIRELKCENRNRNEEICWLKKQNQQLEDAIHLKYPLRHTLRGKRPCY